MAPKRKAGDMEEGVEDHDQTLAISKKPATTPKLRVAAPEEYKIAPIPEADREKVSAAGIYTSTAQLAKDFECCYQVTGPADATKWSDIKRYRNVKFGDTIFSTGDIVYVNNQDKIPGPPPDDASDEKHLAWETKNFWVGKIVESRANSDKAVLVLVAWLYWPGEMPVKWWSGSYGQGELILSNAFDIIDAMTISSPVTDLAFYDEFQDSGIGLVAPRYWRQMFDTMKTPHTKSNLSPLRAFCKCRCAHNPDHKMFHCSNASCGEWLHEECLKQELQLAMKDVAKKGQLDSYVSMHPALATITLTDNNDSLASKIMHPVQAVGKLFNIHQDANSEHEDTASASNMSIDINRPLATKPLQSRGKRSQNDPLVINIKAEDGRALYAQVKKKSGPSSGKVWETSISCLCCGNVMA